MRRDPSRLDRPKGAPWSTVVATTLGPVLMTLGLGNMLRGGAALVVGSVFLVVGIVATVSNLRTQRNTARSSGTVVAPLGRQLLFLAITVVVGALVYFGLLTLMDRS